MKKMNNVLKYTKKNNRRIHFLMPVFFIFFLGSAAFAQNNDAESSAAVNLIGPNDNEIGSVSVNASALKKNSNMNFILWFMGTKEDLNSPKTNDTYFTKKSIISTGREPNRLLLRVLLKRVVNVESC